MGSSFRNVFSFSCTLGLLSASGHPLPKVGRCLSTQVGQSEKEIKISNLVVGYTFGSPFNSGGEEKHDKTKHS